MALHMPAHIGQILGENSPMAQPFTLHPTTSPQTVYGLLYQRQLSASPGDLRPRTGSELVAKLPRTPATEALKPKDLIDGPTHLGASSTRRYQVITRHDNPYPVIDLTLRPYTEA